jgi:hypothetical protein
MLTMGADRILFAVDYRYEDCAQGGDFIDTVPIAEIDRRTLTTTPRRFTSCRRALEL